MNDLRAKIINTWSKKEKRWRLFRIQWESFTKDKQQYSNELSFGVEIKLPDLWIGMFWRREGFGKILWICFIPCIPIRIHLKRSYGGKFA